MQLLPVQGPVFYYKKECKEDLNTTEETLHIFLRCRVLDQHRISNLGVLANDMIKDHTEIPTAEECSNKLTSLLKPPLLPAETY